MCGSHSFEFYVNKHILFQVGGVICWPLDPRQDAERLLHDLLQLPKDREAPAVSIQITSQLTWSYVISNTDLLPLCGTSRTKVGPLICLETAGSMRETSNLGGRLQRQQTF